MINTENLAAGIMGSTGPYEVSLKKATAAIDRAIAAAVQTERDRCATRAAFAISSAVQDERERCARVAEQKHEFTSLDFGEEIAVAIRASE